MSLPPLAALIQQASQSLPQDYWLIMQAVVSNGTSLNLVTNINPHKQTKLKLILVDENTPLVLKLWSSQAEDKAIQGFWNYLDDYKAKGLETIVTFCAFG